MKRNKKKILFIDHTPFVGGAQISLMQHLENIDRENYELCLVCSGDALASGFIEKCDELSVQCRFLSFGRLKTFNPISLVRLARSIFELIRIVKNNNPDILVSNTVRASIIGSVTAIICNKKIVWNIRDYTFPIFLFRFLSRVPKKIIFNSEATALHYGDFPELRKKKEVVYVGRNYDDIKNVDLSHIEMIKNEYGITKEDIVLGFVGRLVDWKGAQVLIEAMCELSEEGLSNVKCLIIGTGDGQKESNEKYLKKMVSENGLSGKIIFTGHQKKIYDFMSIIDILCLTSIEPEPFGAVVIEAMMSGSLVVATNIGGPAEIIRDQVNGFLVPPGDAGELSKKIKYLIDNREKTVEIAEFSRQMAIDRFSAVKTTRKMEEIYKIVLK